MHRAKTLPVGLITAPVRRCLGFLLRQQSSGKTGWELDQELQQIYAREFGMSREDMEDQERRKWLKKKSDAPKPNVVKYPKACPLRNQY